MPDPIQNPAGRIGETTRTGMLAMMAMMAVCCLTVLALGLLIPVLGLPAGVIVAVSAGAALMYAHMKFMKHGANH